MANEEAQELFNLLMAQTRRLVAPSPKILSGAATGAGLGFMAGGPIGALVGGAGGGLLGALTGAITKTIDIWKELNRVTQMLTQNFKDVNATIARANAEWVIVQQDIKRMWGNELAPIIKQMTNVGIRFTREWERIKVILWRSVEPWAKMLVDLLAQSLKLLPIVEILAETFRRVSLICEGLVRTMQLVGETMKLAFAPFQMIGTELARQFGEPNLQQLEEDIQTGLASLRQTITVGTDQIARYFPGFAKALYGIWDVGLRWFEGGGQSRDFTAGMPSWSGKGSASQAVSTSGGSGVVLNLHVRDSADLYRVMNSAFAEIRDHIQIQEGESVVARMYLHTPGSY